MKINSKDYHDYVIKENVLVREFEQMYLNSDEIPWHQNEQANWLDVRLTVELLSRLERFERIVDYGCGLGYYLNIISSRLRIDSKCYGFDISKTAVAKARQLFPQYDFLQADLTLSNNQSILLPKSQNMTLHIIRATLWYVYPEIEIVVSNLIQQLAPQDTLLIVQNFPPLDGEFMGKQVIPNHNALIKHFTGSEARVDRYLWFEQYTDNSSDSWFIGAFRKIE